MIFYDGRYIFFLIINQELVVSCLIKLRLIAACFARGHPFDVARKAMPLQEEANGDPLTSRLHSSLCQQR